MQQTQAAAAQTLLTLRLVFFALIAGVVMFGLIVEFVLSGQPREGDPSVLLASLAILAPSLVTAWVVVRRVLRGGLHARVTETAVDEAPAVLHRGYFTISLVGGALAEGFCFYALIVYMLTADQLALIAAATGLLALVLQLPTADRLYRFTEELKGRRPS